LIALPLDYKQTDEPGKGLVTYTISECIFENNKQVSCLQAARAHTSPAVTNVVLELETAQIFYLLEL
jgi:hypothetical protein